MEENKIRIVLLCRGYTFDAWEAQCIREVQQLPFAEIVLLVSEPQEAHQPPGLFRKISDYPYSFLLWRFYKRFRLRIRAYQPESLEKELKNIPLIECKPELKGKYSQHFSENDLQRIRSYKPDVILRFAYNILRGEILTVAKYGVWSFHHADEQKIRGGPGAFWEIYHGQPVTGAILQRLTEKLDAGIVLRKGFFPTISHSFKANLEQLLWGTTTWMKQALIDVKNGNSPALSGNAVSSSAKVFTFPKNGQMIRFRWKMRRAKLKFHRQELFRPEQWNVGIIESSAEAILANGIPEKITWLPEPPANEYYADPFGWKEKELNVVFEHYRYKEEKGTIGKYSGGKFQELLAKKEHLSYPFVVAENGKRFLLPECNASHSVAAFDTADLSKSISLLNNVPAIDSTPVKFNGKWWLFCTHEGEYNNTNLFLYHSENFAGPFLPHENNPVKCDVRSSRPAGTPFVLHGKLYRPAQDCSESYGAAVVINEITELSETAFREIPARRLEPKSTWKFSKGLHTFSIVDERTILIDAKRYAFNFDNFSRVLRRKLLRLFS